MDQSFVRQLIADLDQAYHAASTAFDSAIFDTGNPYDDMENAEWYIEVAYLKLIAALESLGQHDLRTMVRDHFLSVKATKNGLTKSAQGPDDPYSVELSIFRQFQEGLKVLAPPQDSPKTITKDLTAIIRAANYVITDRTLFSGPPQNELQVHQRIEGILRCVFTELKSRPTLTKPIKNFQPDTGLPELRTLVEYKFVAAASDVAPVSDQILADTRGYQSKEWESFLYVVYETQRFKPEKDWVRHLRDCGTAEDTSIIVLSGEPVARKRRKKKNAS